MEHVAIDDLDRDPAAADRRDLAAALETTHLAINHYDLAPGEGFPSGLHAHADQEEVFLVLAGSVIFERYDPRGDEPTAGEVTVRAGEAVRFPPGEFQTGGNEGDEQCLVVALGAPRESEDVRVPLGCPDCGHDGVRLDTEGGMTFDCPACGGSHVPAPCPDCGGTDLGVTLGDGDHPVVECGDCGAHFAEAPLRE